jgi:hypothetical protein
MQEEYTAMLRMLNEAAANDKRPRTKTGVVVGFLALLTHRPFLLFFWGVIVSCWGWGCALIDVFDPLPLVIPVPRLVRSAGCSLWKCTCPSFACSAPAMYGLAGSLYILCCLWGLHRSAIWRVTV